HHALQPQPEVRARRLPAERGHPRPIRGGQRERRPVISCRCRTSTAIGIVLCLSLAGCSPQAGNLRGPTGSSAAGGQPERSSRGNPPFYDVLGKRYHVLESSEGYRARGVASWYGRDFHGLSPSRGESGRAPWRDREGVPVGGGCLVMTSHVRL